MKERICDNREKSKQEPNLFTWAPVTKHDKHVELVSGQGDNFMGML
jgi:hypothetical protein